MNLANIKTVSVICLGNICRSPIGEVVLRDRFEKHGLEIEVSSGGTGSWHIGEDANPRTIQVLKERNYKVNHVAKQVNKQWFTKNDLLLAMDMNNYRDLQKIGGESNYSKIKMFRQFGPDSKIILDLDSNLEVPDPYYGGLEDFRKVLQLIEKAADGFVQAVINSRKE